MLGGLRLRLRGPKTHRSDFFARQVTHNLDIDPEFKHLSFTFAVVALAARVARADGVLTRAKYLAFRSLFPLNSAMCGKLRSLFTLACSDQTPVGLYARQILHLYPQNAVLHSAIVSNLYQIAATAGTPSQQSEQLLSDIAHQLHLPNSTYRRIHAHYTETPQPNRVLGVGVGVKPRGLKKSYHALMRHYHPDKFSGQSLSPELQSLLALKISEINEAYRMLTKGKR